MFIAGMAMAALAYGTEYYSAVIGYPYNSGGRPFDAWPAFMLAPFAVGILLAAVVGFATFLIETGLPRLHNNLFAVIGAATAGALNRRNVTAIRPPVRYFFIASFTLSGRTLGECTACHRRGVWC